MKTKTLSIPNTKTNYNKVANTVATHMVEKCLEPDEIKQLAIPVSYTHLTLPTIYSV